MTLMSFRLLSAFLMSLSLSSIAHATVYQSNCSVTLGTASEVEWDAEMKTENSEIVQNLHVLGDTSFELSILPGAAAFADVMKVKVHSVKSEFELMSVIFNTGYGSILYSGLLDNQKLELQCTVNKTKD
jgi:hypothetical protein